MPYQFIADDLVRFWSRVLKTDSCWLWMASRKDAGHGQVCIHPVPGKPAIRVRAHRLSWEIHKGPIPEGLNVLHNCPGGDNPACVNPAHLWLGTQTENVADMIAKKRARYVTPRGSEQYNAKLTEADVVDMWQEHRRGVTCRQLALRYGVTKHAIYAILSRRNWKHVVA